MIRASEICGPQVKKYVYNEVLDREEKDIENNYGSNLSKFDVKTNFTSEIFKPLNVR